MLPPLGKTYSSSTDFFTDSADMAIAALLFMSEKFVGSFLDCKDKFVAHCLVRDIVRRRQNGIGEPDQPSPNAEAQADHSHETFRLWGDDFRPENVLLDENGAVVGVVDWEYTYFAPETYWVNPPWWLPLEVMEDYINEDTDSGTLNQEEVSHDAEKGKEKQGNRDFQKQWDELLRTYVRALERAETKLQNEQQVESRSNHLCLRSNKGLTVSASIAQHPSLSQLMRQRWDEDKVEFALTTSLAQNFLLDNFFWGYIDEFYWGENSVGRHEGRFELLNPQRRMLMDWFVHRRAEEQQKWDPEDLLDQVLGQMDGKFSALTI